MMWLKKRKSYSVSTLDLYQANNNIDLKSSKTYFGSQGDILDSKSLRSLFFTFILGLLDSIGTSAEDIEGIKWTSQSEELLNSASGNFESRKVSPPLLAVLSEPSRSRSGSDPSVSKHGLEHRHRTCSHETTITSPKQCKTFFELERGAAEGGGARERDFSLSFCVSLTELHRFSSSKRAGNSNWS